ncbi:MAG TPA: gliding motility protein GldM [Chitinophagaceae bacterium]|nr:gliding motility protein GldM [Chitinophagaceae bacterium]
MALPKEPRQKMINMMYLVLTALLALNVSSEILNAFKTVNNSLGESNKVLTGSTNNVMLAFTELAKDESKRERVTEWQPIAVNAIALSKKMSDRLDSLKDKLMKAAGYNPAEGDTTFAEDNLDIPTRIMDKEGEGPKLLKELQDYKKNMLALHPDISKEFANKIPIDLTVPKSQTGSTGKDDWTTAYFHMTPTIAAITMLSKFQNDVKNTENQIANYALTRVGQVKIVFNKFEALVGTSSTYVMPGEEVTVTAGLGAFNADAQPTVTVDGRPVPVGPNGVATTKFAAGGSGSRKMRVVVSFTNPNTGKPEQVVKDIEYTVGQPAGVAVSADKMNVLYIGVENPLTITAGAGSEKVNATFSGGSISRIQGPKWVAKPTSPGEHNINVVVEGKSTPVRFRVKYLPNPAAFVGSSRGGAMSAAAFKAQGGVIARLEDSDFEASFRVVSYTLGAIGGPIQQYREAANDGNRWNGAAGAIVSAAGPGTNVFIDKLIVIGPDGRRRELPAMVFNLK